MLNGPVEAAAFLDLDEDEPLAIAGNQVDFTTRSAPAPMCDGKTAPFVILRHPMFGSQTVVIPASAAKLPVRGPRW